MSLWSVLYYCISPTSSNKVWTLKMAVDIMSVMFGMHRGKPLQAVRTRGTVVEVYADSIEIYL